MKALPFFAASLLLVACSSEPDVADPEAEDLGEITLPTEADGAAIEAAAKEAGEAITEENADVTLDELEALYDE